MIKLREYKTEDYTAIQDAVEPFCVSEDVEAATTQGVAITATDGDVMACGGVCMVGDEGIAWMKISKKCKKNAYTWARTIKEAFKLMIESVDIPVSTYVLKGFCQGDRLARAIGMKKTDEQKELNGNTYYKYTVV
jgi:hypothetical protein